VRICDDGAGQCDYEVEEDEAAEEMARAKVKAINSNRELKGRAAPSSGWMSKTVWAAK
jgi:hypothetical protein